MSDVTLSNKLSAVVFDFDGTLVDSFNFMFSIYLSELTKKLPFAQIPDITSVSQKFVEDETKEGMKNPKKLVLKVFYKTSRALGLSRSSSANVTLRTAYRIQKRYTEIEVFPSAEELLKILNESGVPTILITLSSKKKVIEILKKNDLEKYFQIIIDKNSLQNFEKAKGIEDSLIALGLDKKDLSNVIALGDLPSDIEDGKMAGVKTGAVLTGPVEASKLEEANPDYIFTDLNDVLTIFKRDFSS